MSNQTATKDKSRLAIDNFYSARIYSANPKDFTLVHPVKKFSNAIDISSPSKKVVLPIKRTSKHRREKVINRSSFVSAPSYPYVRGTTNSETLTSKSFHPLGIQGKKNISEAMIDEYFSDSPSSRAQKREKYATYIKCAKDVFKILELGNTRNIVDAYDGAVDILAECDEDIITKAFGTAKEKYISHVQLETAKSWEKNWEILIKALSYGLKIQPHKKMSLLLSLCDHKYKLSRLIKLTLIDAIVDLDIDVDLVKVMLQIFMSERESDSFVRQYAEKQAVECL